MENKKLYKEDPISMLKSDEMRDMSQEERQAKIGNRTDYVIAHNLAVIAERQEVLVEKINALVILLAKNSEASKLFAAMMRQQGLMGRKN